MSEKWENSTVLESAFLEIFSKIFLGEIIFFANGGARKFTFGLRPPTLGRPDYLYYRGHPNEGKTRNAPLLTHFKARSVPRAGHDFGAGARKNGGLARARARVRALFSVKRF